MLLMIRSLVARLRLNRLFGSLFFWRAGPKFRCRLLASVNRVVLVRKNMLKLVLVMF